MGNIFVPFLIIAVILLIPFFLRINTVQMRSKVHFKIVATYIVILIVSTVIYLLVLEPKLPQYDAEAIEESEEWGLRAEEYYTSQLKPEYLRDAWEIKMEGEQFSIKANNQSGELWFSELFIVIERSEQQTNTILVEQYQPEVVLYLPGEVDVTALIPTVHIPYTNKQMEVKFSSDMGTEAIHLAILTNPFILRQFQPFKNLLYDDHGSGMSEGLQTVFISVPKHIQLNVDEALEDYVYILGEEN